MSRPGACSRRRGDPGAWPDGAATATLKAPCPLEMSQGTPRHGPSLFTRNHPDPFPSLLHPCCRGHQHPLGWWALGVCVVSFSLGNIRADLLPALITGMAPSRGFSFIKHPCLPGRGDPCPAAAAIGAATGTLCSMGALNIYRGTQPSGSRCRVLQRWQKKGWRLCTRGSW